LTYLPLLLLLLLPLLLPLPLVWAELLRTSKSCSQLPRPFALLLLLFQHSFCTRHH
jgi:hypothetical protein